MINFPIRLFVNRYRGSYQYLEDLPPLNVVGTRKIIFVDPGDIMRLRENLLQDLNIKNDSDIIFEGTVISLARFGGDKGYDTIRIDEEYDIIKTAKIISYATEENSNNFHKGLIGFDNLYLYQGRKFLTVIRELPRNIAKIQQRANKSRRFMVTMDSLDAVYSDN